MLQTIAKEVADNRHSPDLAYWLDLDARLKALSTKENWPADDKNRFWFLRRYVHAAICYVEAFRDMRLGEFYKAWRQLEHAELHARSLARNPFYPPEDFEVAALTDLVAKWQTIFPYRLFFSPGMKVKRGECSICGSVRTADAHCGHRAGFVYDGKECVTRITSADMLEISIVRNPVQKYSVLFADKIDTYDYGLVRGVVAMLAEPFDRWEGRWTTALHDHALFHHLEVSGPCPCQSSLTYEECCATKPGVRRPHYEVRLSKEPPKGAPPIRLAGYSESQLKQLIGTADG